MRGRALLVDDDVALCETLVTGLSRRGFEVSSCVTAEEAETTAMAADLDVVITDLNMRGLGGIELCQRIVANRRDVPVIVLTAFGSLETAVAAIRAGAYDFISKPVQLDVLAIALDRAVAHRKLREEVKLLRERAGARPRFDELIGRSPAMQSVCELMERVADTEASVLITGESGTGKEVVARAIHERSRRKAGPFVAVNCAAMPEALLESELFGHTRGAFTDAKDTRTGLIVQAQHGTMLLDEIGDMPLGLQPKLLRVLQERVVRPLGSSAEVRVDARFIAATNRDLETAVEEKHFREDLYFRINVIKVELPPLRSRAGDVMLIAQHFLSQLSTGTDRQVRGFSPAAAQRLLAYHWPGNVRELRNCIERAVALARYDEIAPDDLPEKIRNYKSSHIVVAADDPSEFAPMAEVERRYILRVLEAVAGNKTAAARILGLERKTLYRKLERFGAGPTQE